MNDRPKLSRSFIDIVSLVSGLVGIFGFITGITSIPYFLTTSTNNPTGTATWFGWIIPWYISIPVFLVTILFVYGVYFLLLIRAYRRLYTLGVVKEKRQKYDVPFPVMDLMEEESGYIFTLLFFSLFGIAVGIPLFAAFFQLPTTSQEFQAMIGNGAGIPPVMFIVFFYLYFLGQMCSAARNGAIHLEEPDTQPKQPPFRAPRRY